MTPELLSEVLNRRIRSVEHNNGELVEYYDEDENFGDGLWIDDFNIYELAHKCKMWAYSLDEYVVESGLSNGEAYANIYGRYSCSDSEPEETMVEDTEPEAVFKACEWILREQE